ncbi:MAG: mechanosensitive ion channel [Alphaproteobacteria bacterium]|nr:mechanosensitive ion channel [Alphaproteobacteria bacterium]
MEKIGAKLLDALSAWVMNIADVIHHASDVEKISAVLLPIIAILASEWLNARIDRISRKSWVTRIIDFSGPLLAPILAILFTASLVFSFVITEESHQLLNFLFKLAIAWLAIRAVVLMSSRKAAGWMIALVVMPITMLQLFGLWKPVTTALKEIDFAIGDFKFTAFTILQSLLAIIILFWIAGFIVSAVDNRLKRIRGIHVSNKALMSKLFQIFVYFVVFIIIMQILGISLTALSVFGGALGVGLGFGLQKIASNFISGIILLFEKSSQVGDVIELADGTVGTILQTSARYTLLETVDGREVLIPNEDFITQRMVNWTYSNKRARAEIKISVDYKTDLELAKNLVLAAARAHPKCLSDPAPACFCTDFGDSGILMVLYFWIDDISDGRLGPRSDIIMAIHKAFKENDIIIPFPHQVHIDGGKG